MKNVQQLEGEDLLEALGVETAEPETGGYTPRQERILAGFEDVVRFRAKRMAVPRSTGSIWTSSSGSTRYG